VERHRLPQGHNFCAGDPTAHRVCLLRLLTHPSALCAFVAKFPHAYAHHHLPCSVLDSLRWWQAILSFPPVPRSLLKRWHLDLDMWVDASTSFGIGIVVQHKWAAWALLPGWKAGGCDIGWAKAIALKLAVLWVCSAGHVDAEIVIRGDNKSVIDSFMKGHSHNEQRTHSICRIASCIVPCNLTIVLLYVPSATNRADPFSRGVLGPNALRLPCPFLCTAT
jgi:hypothetical protein